VGLFDYDDVGCSASTLRAELLDKALSSDNNNVPVAADAWSPASGTMDLNLRSLASLLPLDDFKYPLGVDMPSLDTLVANYSTPAAPVLLDRPQGEGGLCGFVSGGSDSSRSGSGSSPPATGSPAESLASPRRIQATLPPGCLCFLCTQAPVSAALVPCGHNLFCKACADLVVSRPELTDRRCPVCGEQASLAIRILS